MKEELLKQLLELPVGAWHEENDIDVKNPTFGQTYLCLIRKRKFLQEQIKKLEI